MSSFRSCSVSVNIVSPHLSAVARSDAMFSTNGYDKGTVGQALDQPSLEIYISLAFTNNVEGLH